MYYLIYFTWLSKRTTEDSIRYTNDTQMIFKQSKSNMSFVFFFPIVSSCCILALIVLQEHVPHDFFKDSFI